MTPKGFDFGPRRHPRRMSLTPMIDVVFLLLIFFMLASRFGTDAVLPIITGAESSGGAAEWQGAPRLVEIAADGVVLNGVAIADADLGAQLGPLLPAPDAPVVLRAGEGASTQRLVDVIDRIRAEGLGKPVLIE